MKRCYVEKNFRKDSLDLINQINDIIDEYQAQGYELTLRQVYYQLVARDVVPNNERSYKNVGNLINDARLAGLIDWNAIVDRTRNVRIQSHWDSPADILRSALYSYRIDKRTTQLNYIEVWVEKDALISIIEGVAKTKDVPCFSCRGYVSQSEMYEAAMRFRNAERNGKECYLIHLGDHDPSGIDMTRDIQERLELFGAHVTVDRIALNMDQIQQYNPPENPAKLTDSRSDGYISEHGDASWELDALEPRVLEALISTHIDMLTDQDLIDEQQAIEDKHKQRLQEMIDSFNEEDEDNE